MTKVPATKLSLQYFRGLGVLAEKTEHRLSMPGQRFAKTKDLFDFVDIIAIRGPEVVFVQTTSVANKAHRLRKMEEWNVATKVHEVLKAGRVEFHCWKKVGGTYEVRVFTISMEYGPDSRDYATATEIAAPTMAEARKRMRDRERELAESKK